MSLALNTKHLSSFINEEEYKAIYPQVEAAHKTLEAKNGPGSDFLGWMYLPRDYDKEEFERIKAAAAKIREDSDVLVVAGIGGSYLGARAVVEAVKGMYHNELEDGLKIYFCGNSISPTYLNNIISLCKGKRFSINVISKSGTTTETSLAFRVLRKLLEDEMGVEEANKRIYATTDAHKGALKGLADAEGYEEFVVPDAVGGRYSVLTAVGLLPIACAGVDIAALMEGAACESIAPYLAEGETSVGVSLQLFHTAATPVGMEVRAESVVTAVDGKKITFTVTAYDEAGEIGHAQHERVIVKAERFLEKTYDKL